MRARRWEYHYFLLALVTCWLDVSQSPATNYFSSLNQNFSEFND